MDPIGSGPKPPSKYQLLLDTLDTAAIQLDGDSRRRQLRSPSLEQLDPVELGQLNLLISLILDELAMPTVHVSQPVSVTFLLGTGYHVSGYANVLEANTRDGQSFVSILIAKRDGRFVIRTMGCGVRPRNRDGSSMWVAGGTSLPDYRRLCRFVTGYLNACENTGLDRRVK